MPRPPAHSAHGSDPSDDGPERSGSAEIPVSADSTEFRAELVSFGRSPRETDHGRDEIERLASQFIDALRNGSTARDESGPLLPAPAATSDADTNERLRDVLPIVAALEQWKAVRETESLRGGLPTSFNVRQLGNCRILREIGRGGNGIVFEAIQGVTWHQRVAVKVFPWRFAADLSPLRQRFRDEASTLSELRHENIVPVFSFGEQGGYCYYVMELVPGRSLDREIESRRAAVTLPASRAKLDSDAANSSRWHEVARIGLQVCQAMRYAHGRGVLHNDIKPANLLLRPDGRVIVTDFGASPRLRPEGGSSQQLTGTHRYMAPERFRGVSDPRSDIYALGATLYELATLRPAFAISDREELVWKIDRGAVPLPRAFAPGLPSGLQEVILRAMSLDPEDRYATATDMAADLLRFLHGQPVVGKRVSWAAWWRRLGRRVRGR